MRLTPLDLRNHRFSRRVRGFDAKEVGGFLQLVADDYEALVREVEALQRTVRELSSRRDELEGNERALREAIVTTQAVGQELKENAHKEAYLIVEKAEIQAVQILEGAERRAIRLNEEVRELRVLRGRLGSELRCTIEGCLTMVEEMVLAGSEPEEPPKPALASSGPSPASPVTPPTGQPLNPGA